MSSTERKESEVIKAVEDFIRDFHNGDLTLSPEATDICLKIAISPREREEFKRFGIKTSSEMKKTVADCIAWAIANYLVDKDLEKPFHDRLPHAYKTLDYIERARAYGMVIPKKLTSDLKECQEQNKQLKELNEKLSRENVHQKKLIEELHKTISTITAKGLRKAGEG